MQLGLGVLEVAEVLLQERLLRRLGARCLGFHRCLARLGQHSPSVVVALSQPVLLSRYVCAQLVHSALHRKGEPVGNKLHGRGDVRVSEQGVLGTWRPNIPWCVTGVHTCERVCTYLGVKSLEAAEERELVA